jgi:hypothetical protein
MADSTSSFDPNHGTASSFVDEESPFFADITLDLAEAHDIAETPEPIQRSVLDITISRDMPQMPVIPDNDAVPLSSGGGGSGGGGGIELAPVTTMTSGGGVAESITTTMDGDLGDFQGTLNAITSEQTHGAHTSNQSSLPPSAKRYPRDIPWAVGFCIFVPLSLLLPMLFAQPSTDTVWLATALSPRLATLHTLLWGFVASLILLRLLYRTMGGGDGDDARHVAAQILLASAPISVSVYISLILTLYFLTPHALHFAVVPLWYLARDLYLFRRWKMTATTPGGRQAFFQALTCMTLDILSRSLRRSSFYRIVSSLVVVQLIVIAWWRLALLAAFRSRSIIWIAIVMLGGKWATGTVARLLSLIASGGISSWFAEQNSLVQAMHDSDREEMIEFTPLSENKSFDNTSDDGEGLPEAYRTADASAYKSALVPDEGMDDDFEDEDEEDLQPRGLFNRTTTTASPAGGSTVKQLLFTGLTTSFGSVAKCGLLGGLAQFLWSQIRKIDTARATFGNLHGMSVGTSSGEDSVLNKYLLLANIWARDFVRSHSDMAMSHVAAFQKSYQRAALDVATLIDESGTLLLVD